MRRLTLPLLMLLPGFALAGEAAPPEGALPLKGWLMDLGLIEPTIQFHQLGAVGDVPFTSRLISLLGLTLLLCASWLMSAHRDRIPWRVVGWGLGIQVALGVLLLRTPFGKGFFVTIGAGVDKIMGYYREGTLLVFGKDLIESFPFSFLLNVLPTIIFFSSLMAVLYHLRVMQLLVGGIAWLMRRTLHTSGAESLSAAGNIFVGQTEAPLLIRPYVKEMTQSELMAVMVGGFATVAGGVMVAYVSMFGDAFPGIAGHLMIASIMSAPAALVTAKLMYPETGNPVTAGVKAKAEKSEYANVIDAAATGAADGLKLAMNVAAMLLAFVGLVALLNGIIGGVGGWFGYGDLSFQQILGWLLAPVAWLMGIPWEDATTAGSLLGTKTVLNEFYAYDTLSTMVKTGAFKDTRSVVILTYALCGFANFGSIAIQVGGISAIAPTRRKDLARLGIRAMIGGTIAAFMTATLAGILI